MSALVRHGEERWSFDGSASPEVLRELWEALDRLWDRLDSGRWWGQIRDVLVQDSLGRTWVLHLFGNRVEEGYLAALGPLEEAGSLTLGQLIDRLAAALGLPSGPGTGPSPQPPGEPVCQFFFRQFLTDLLQAVRQGDRPGLDLVWEQFLNQIPPSAFFYPEENLRESLEGFLVHCREAGVQGGLAPGHVQALTDRFRPRLLEARTPAEGLQILVPLSRVFCGAVARAPFSGRSAKTRALVRYLRDHIDGPLPLAEAAAAVGLSPNYASYLLKQEGGQSYAQTLRHWRVYRACGYLKTTDLPVAEVGRRVGFRHPSHFARVFREFLGQGPQEFRCSVSEIVDSVPIPEDRPFPVPSLG